MWPRVGDRFAALQPAYDAVVDRWGRLDADVARGLALRHDWGPQYRSAHFTGSLAWLGINDSPAFLGEPETNGCAERWIRTLKEQCLWVQLHDTVEELRQAVAGFVDRYDCSWLIHRHGHQTPKEAYQAARASARCEIGRFQMERGGCSERRSAGPADPRADQENLASYANGVLAGALIRQLKRQQRHEQVGTTSVQETGRCSTAHKIMTSASLNIFIH
jgi:transposase InsO family protein